VLMALCCSVCMVCDCLVTRGNAGAWLKQTEALPTVHCKRRLCKQCTSNQCLCGDTGSVCRTCVRISIVSDTLVCVGHWMCVCVCVCVCVCDAKLHALY
jgi:hypothetical protein